MKKLLVFLLSAIIGLTTVGIVGCRNNKSGVTELNVWCVAPLIYNYSNTLKLNPNDKQALLTKYIVEEFEKDNPDIKLNLLFKGWGNALNEQLVAGLNLKGQSAPDIVVGEQYVKTFIDNGNFAELDLGEYKTDIIDQAANYMYKDEKCYAVPITTGTYGLNINLKMLEECRIIDAEGTISAAWREVMSEYVSAVNGMNAKYTCTVAAEINPLAPAYFEDMLAICLFIRDYYDGKISVNNVTYQGSDGASKGGMVMTETISDAPWQNLLYMRNAGGDFVDANGDVDLDSEENLLAYQMLRELQKTVGTSGMVNAASEFNVQFYGNYGVYAVQGAELKTRAYKYNFDAEDIALTYVPMFSSVKKHSNTMVGSVFMSVNKNKSQNLEKSTKFIKYLLSDEIQYKFMEEDGRIPVRKSLLESDDIKNKSNYTDLEPLFKTFNEWDFEGMLYGFPNNASQIWEAYLAFVNELYSDANLAEALTNADNTMQYYLDRE